jgi:uncharacterized protein YodC (DUF2158 family)
MGGEGRVGGRLMGITDSQTKELWYGKYSCRMQKRVGASRDDFSTTEEEAAGAEVQRCRWVRREEKREFVWLDGWLALLAGPGPGTPPSMRIACGGW